MNLLHINLSTVIINKLYNGISLESISKLLGHSNVKETQVYAKIINEELDKAMDVFNIKSPEEETKKGKK